MRNQHRNKNAETTIEVMPYHRRWNNTGFHTHHNKIGGAFGVTKREWNEMIEDRNRKNKAIRQKLKSK
jgi:hypothetical protein